MDRYAEEDLWVNASKLSPPKDNRHTTSIRVIASGDFRWQVRTLQHFRTDTPPNSHDQKPIPLSRLQKGMIALGQLLSRSLRELSLSHKRNVCDKQVKAYDQLIRLISPKQLIIHESAKSVVYGEQHYRLPPDQVCAYVIMAREHKAGNTWIHKDDIFGPINTDREQSQTMRLDASNSIWGWFKDTGGDAQRLAEDGLIETNPKHNGTCRIPVDPGLIDIRNAVQD